MCGRGDCTPTLPTARGAPRPLDNTFAPWRSVYEEQSVTETSAQANILIASGFALARLWFRRTRGAEHVLRQRTLRAARRMRQMGNRPRRSESRPGHGPGRCGAHDPERRFPAPSRFAEQHVFGAVHLRWTPARHSRSCSHHHRVRIALRARSVISPETPGCAAIYGVRPSIRREVGFFRVRRRLCGYCRRATATPLRAARRLLAACRERLRRTRACCGRGTARRCSP